MLGSDYFTLLMFIDSTTPQVLNAGKRGCYASLSPDDGRRILHLELEHDRLLIHDAADNLVWQAAMPEGTNYVNMPRWSNHPDYVVFTARETNSSFSTFLVKLSSIDPETGMAKPGQSGPVRIVDARTGGRSWSHPFLWLKPPANDAGPPDAVNAAADADAAGGCGLAGQASRAQLALVLFLFAAAVRKKRLSKARKRPSKKSV